MCAWTLVEELVCRGHKPCFHSNTLSSTFRLVLGGSHFMPPRHMRVTHRFRLEPGEVPSPHNKHGKQTDCTAGAVHHRYHRPRSRLSGASFCHTDALTLFASLRWERVTITHLPLAVCVHARLCVCVCMRQLAQPHTLRKTGSVVRELGLHKP